MMEEQVQTSKSLALRTMNSQVNISSQAALLASQAPSRTNLNSKNAQRVVLARRKQALKSSSGKSLLDESSFSQRDFQITGQ